MRSSLRKTLALVLVTTAALVACGLDRPSNPAAHTKDSPSIAPQPPERLRVQVLETLPHDPNAFTQGLEIAHGTLYESTGLVGQSSVRATDIASGEEIARALLDPPLFGEGITLTPSSLWQLTWRDEIAIERDPETLDERRRVSYSGEGWGLCYQASNERLVMSDGSANLTFRDPDTFERIGRVQVHSGNAKVTHLNELECVDDIVYANIWLTDTIVRIDPATGKVLAEIDASGLLSEAELADADVLNGIAAVPGSDAFLITGKLWPKMFRVRFVPSS